MVWVRQPGRAAKVPSPSGEDADGRPSTKRPFLFARTPRASESGHFASFRVYVTSCQVLAMTGA